MASQTARIGQKNAAGVHHAPVRAMGVSARAGALRGSTTSAIAPELAPVGCVPTCGFPAAR